MTAEFVSTVGEATAAGDDARSVEADHGHRLATVPHRGMSAHDDEAAGEFDVHVLPIGPVARFKDADTGAEAAAILEVLRRIGGRPAPHPVRKPGPAGEPVTTTLKSLSAVDDELARWSVEYGAGEERRPKERPSVLVWLGHGVSRTMGPALVVPGSEQRADDPLVTPDLFAHHLYAEWGNRRAEDGQWAIVVIEACKSSDFAIKVRGRFDDTPDDPYSILLIATGRRAAQAYLGNFREALEEYLDRLTSHDQVFTLQDLRRHFHQARYWSEWVGEPYTELALTLPDRVPLPGATTVAEQQRLQAEFDVTPLTGARMVEPLQEAGSTGFLEVVPHFTGRAAELSAVEQWCADPGAQRVLIVPGAPGAGKSAFLGELLRRIRTMEAGTAAGLRVGAVLRLTGSTTEEVRAKLEQVPELRATDEPSGGVTAPCTGGEFLVLADALDEARDPVQVASLLREVTDHPRVSLVVGTRTTPYGAEMGAGGSRVDLPTVLGSNTERARVMELLPDPVAAADYAADGVRRVLRDHSTDDPGWQETVVRIVREAVEQHVSDGSWQFLQASLVVQEIEQNPQVLSPAAASQNALQRLLNRDRTGLFGAAVERITRDLPAALPFLQALALAHGRGLPRADGIWLQAATGLAAAELKEAGRALDERTLSDFLSKAAAYVLLDGEDRRSVYRLTHRTYADRLAADITSGQRLAMVKALLDLAAEQVAAGQPLSPHLQSRLAEYAADCGTPGWRELALYPAVLDQLEVVALCGLALAPGRGIAGATSADLPVEVLGTVTSAHLIQRSEAADRPGLRQLGGLRACGTVQTAGSEAAWEVCWGRVPRTPSRLQLDAGVRATALATDPDRPWLVTGSRDGSVVLWTPWRTHAPVLLLRGGESPVTAVAASGSADGEEPGLIVAAHDDRTLEIWDTGVDPRVPVVVSTPQVIWHMAALPGGRFAVAGEGGWLAVLEPGTTRLFPARSAAESEVVGLVSVTGPKGEHWLATAEQAGDLNLWDVSGERPELVDKAYARCRLAALTSVTDAQGGLRLAAAGDDGSVWLWRPAERNGVVPMAAAEDTPTRGPGISRPVLAGWRVSGGGGESVVLGDHQGLWVVRAGGPRQPVSGGDPGGIRAIGVLSGADGEPVVATMPERSSVIHLWDPSVHAADEAVAQPLGPITGMRRRVLQDGTETLELRLTARSDTTERILRAADGRDLTHEAQGGPLAADPMREGADEGSPSPVAHAYQGPVGDLVSLRGEAHRRARAMLEPEGDVVLWREETDGSLTPTHRMRLGTTGIGLIALSGGRLAVALRNGVVVLMVGAGAFADSDEETGEDDV